MAFPRNLLNHNEELVLDLRPHWYFLTRPALAVLGSMIVAVLGIVVWTPPDSISTVVNVVCLGLLGASLLWFGWRYMVWNSTMFVLTSDRILSRKGVLSKQGVEIPLERVNTVFFKQSPFERLLGTGDLAIESASERGSESFNNIRKPHIVQKEIYVQMEANENRKFDRMSASAANAAARPTDATTPQSDPGAIPEQIDKLSELHQRGILSDAEYQAKKAELLDRM